MKILRIYFIITLILTSIYAKNNPVNISFQDLKIEDLIKITSRILDKNILLTTKINGKVDFITNKQLYEDDVYNILIYVLESKGYTMVENNNILRIIKINDSAKYNLPVVSGNKNKVYFQMITKVFSVQYSNVEYVASKIRHLISKSAKLVTDKESNVIVITDFEKNIKTIQKVIKLISKDAKKTVESIKLKNIQATPAANTLKNIAKSVFNIKIAKEKVTVLANKDNNSLLIIGNQKNVQFLKEYILSVDKIGSMAEKVVEVITLKNAEVSSVIKILTSIIDKKKYVDANSKPYASTDEESNSVIVVGPKYEVKYIKELLNKLDKERLQVYVQAKIIEVSENRIQNIGAKYGLSHLQLNSSSIFTLGANFGGVVDALSSSSITSGTISNGVALGATINLLKNNQAIDIVSEPSILSLNNKESSIYVGETKSFQTGTATTDGGTTSNTFQREDIGLTLKVKPRISDFNKVTLEIETILEDARELKDGQTNPDTTKKEVKTTVIVKNGESVILGGLIKTKTDIIEDKVPLLGDIPLLGAIFKNKREAEDKINLVVIMTPYIIPKNEGLSNIRKTLSELKLLEEEYSQDLELRLLRRKLKMETRQLDIKKKTIELEKQKLQLEKDQQKVDKQKSDMTKPIVIEVLNNNTVS